MRTGPISPKRIIPPHQPIWLSAALMPIIIIIVAIIIKVIISVPTCYYDSILLPALLFTPYPYWVYLRENNVRNSSVYRTWQIILCEEQTHEVTCAMVLVFAEI